MQQTPISVGDKTTIINDATVSLLTDTGISSVTQTDIRSMEILDKELADELQRALATIAQHRDDRWTTINLGFTGKKERKALVAYTHEAPVWKTSYRLILPDDTDGSPTLQGWAIVENDTNEDWNDVRLTLASGRPVSFVMDLQTPLILRRPIVPVPMIALLGPQMYEGGYANGLASRSRSMDQATTFTVEEGAANYTEDIASFQTKRTPLPGSIAGRRPTDQAFGGSITSADLINNSAAAGASAGDVGQQFFYTIDAPVSIARGKSSMLPIISAPIEGRRLSIYSWNSTDSRALFGVRLTNNTGLDLAPGPLAVYDSGAYAGDAVIQHVSPGADRLLSYAVDFDLDAHRKENSTHEITKIRISKGLIVQTTSSIRTTSYTFTNNDDEPRMVLIEHPKIAGWKILGETTPNEETDSLYRFELPIAAGETEDLKVVVENIRFQRVGLTNMNIAQLQVYVRNGVASKAVLDAVSHAAGIQSKINSLQARFNQLNEETNRVTAEQSRIRKNMNSIERRSDLYTRYIKKLNAQETRLESIDSERQDIQRQRNAAQQELSDFLSGLKVN